MIEPGLTRDGFLGGRLSILQPAAGYRAGIDPVFLAAAVPASSGEEVLELGCGVGTAALCLGARVDGVRLTGLEKQAAYADLARRNAAANSITLDTITGRLEAMPDALRTRSFDHVIANPPYWHEHARTRSSDLGREAALAEEAPLAAWCDTAVRRLRPGGWLTLIQAAERLPDVLACLDQRVGAIKVYPIAPRAGRDANRVIVQAVKGSCAVARIAAPLILHDGAAHANDGDTYTPPVRAVLRDGASLPWLQH